jgi:DeoR/GlpR family transcriptional regulator of sugar metabolism
MNAGLSERERQILTLLAEDATVSVADVSDKLAVSKVTVRSDFSSLEEKGFLIRTHGGAMPAFHSSIMERNRNRTDEKNRIAKAAAAMVQDGDTVMIEAGTTTALIVRYLIGKRDLHIVTNSTLLIPYARTNPQLHLTVVGGEFRPATESLVGPIALRELEEFHVRKVFLGTDGFSLENGSSTHLVEGAEVNKRMALQADQRFLVADSSKYGRAGFVRMLPLGSYNKIITDTGMSDEVAAMLAEAGLEIERV